MEKIFSASTVSQLTSASPGSVRKDDCFYLDICMRLRHYDFFPTMFALLASKKWKAELRKTYLHWLFFKTKIFRQFESIRWCRSFSFLYLLVLSNIEWIHACRFLWVYYKSPLLCMYIYIKVGILGKCFLFLLRCNHTSWLTALTSHAYLFTITILLTTFWCWWTIRNSIPIQKTSIRHRIDKKVCRL